MSAWQYKHLSTRVTDDDFVRVDIDQPNYSDAYNKAICGVDQMEQNIRY